MKHRTMRFKLSAELEKKLSAACNKTEDSMSTMLNKLLTMALEAKENDNGNHNEDK